MMIKRKLLLAAILAATGLLQRAEADDSYIYWLVDGSAEQAEFSYATVRMGNDYLFVYNPGGGSTGSTMLYADDDGVAGPAYSGTIASGYTGSLLFEMWNENDLVFESIVINHDTWIAHAYTDLVMSGATPLLLSLPVPEPTSGLLLLFGLAGLALRRREVKV